jgi:hypothetical protein
MKTVATLLLIELTIVAFVTPVVRAEENDTNIRTPFFQVTLPGTWRQLPSDDAFAFSRNADQVFVTYLEPEKRLDWKETKRISARLAEVRQKALTDISGGTAKFSKILGSVKDERQVFTFTGTDPKNAKRFYVAVVGLESVFVTVAVYRPLTSPAQDFEDLSNRIMRTVRRAAG